MLEPTLLRLNLTYDLFSKSDTGEVRWSLTFIPHCSVSSSWYIRSVEYSGMSRQ